MRRPGNTEPIQMTQLSISAVARMTQIPAHTLRKWESRHGIAVPKRTDTGRRVYNEDQVELLKLVKALTASGHALMHLAGLSIDEMRELAGMHAVDARRTKVRSLALVGPNVARLLIANSLVQSRFSGDADDWLQRHDEIAADAVLIECETLPGDLVHRIQQLSERVKLVLVLFTFASRQTLSQLADAGVLTLQAPLSDAGLMLRLEQLEEPAPQRRELPHRFSTEELARIAHLNPGLHCECPNHIAKLLMDITSFEKYSRECVDTDPAEKALHTQLGDISAQARLLFEEALIAVATADGLQVSLRE